MNTFFGMLVSFPLVIIYILLSLWVVLGWVFFPILIAVGMNSWWGLLWGFMVWWVGYSAIISSKVLG